MALSLSSPQVKLTVHSKTQHSLTSFYSTPRKFNNSTEDGTSQEVLSGIGRGQMAPLLLPSSSFEHAIVSQHGLPRVVPSSQVIPDLPSWTPLRVLEDDEGSSTFEVDEPSGVSPRKTNQVRRSSKLGHDPSEFQAVAPMDSTSIPGHPKRDNLKKKKARFAGVVIVSKYRHPIPASRASRSRALPPREAASESNALSLVDALKRTFDANKHADGSPHRASSLPRRLERLRTTQEQDNCAPTTPGPPTDVELGSTEPDEERPQPNNRLLAPRTPKRHLTRAARAVARSESNNDSERDATSTSRDASVRPERPAKRLKPIPYDAYATFVDRALGTVQAPISWDAEPDFIINDAPVVRHRPPEPTSADVPMDIDHEMDGANPVPGEGFEAHLDPDSIAGNARRTPALRLPQKVVFSPRIPRGDKFKERLVAVFGENATVRMDKAARPRPAAFDLFAPLDELDRAPSPNPSEFSASGTPPSIAEAVISTRPSTQFTGQSPQLPSTPSPSASHGGPATSKAAFETNEEQISVWITALQRLIKGKVYVNEGDLEKLSIVLAEIESVKDSLDARGPMTMELHAALNQLSELQEIPFGDRNQLRRRARRTLLGWPTSAPRVG